MRAMGARGENAGVEKVHTGQQDWTSRMSQTPGPHRPAWISVPLFAQLDDLAQASGIFLSPSFITYEVGLA